MIRQHGLHWCVGATPEALKKRAFFTNAVRNFFATREVLEVETPILGNYTATDAFTTSLKYLSDTHQGYLQTSPESYLKQYIAHYPNTDVYSLAKAFRDDSPSPHHQPEFTMLEWYRHNFSWQALSNEVIDLIKALNNSSNASNKAVEVRHISYQECFQRYVNECIFDDTVAWYKVYKRHKNSSINGVGEMDDKLWKQLIWSDIIEPNFSPDESVKSTNIIITVVHDYPEELALMAKCAPLSLEEIAKSQKNIPADTHIAKRFEIYYNGVELANGWEENTDKRLLHAQMQHDLEERKLRHLNCVPIDSPLLNAIEKITAISGVALGIDRLYTQLQNHSSINENLAFYSKIQQ